jgi:hypothetical protein
MAHPTRGENDEEARASSIGKKIDEINLGQPA